MPSPQERLVLQMAMAGLADKEIARRLSVTTATVRRHIARLCEKLGATNRCQMAHIATREGLYDRGHGPEAPALSSVQSWDA